MPAARRGRYTPDIAFSASAHDGYFGCFAAGAGDCNNAADGTYRFEFFAGTSAAAPSMAGIAATLNTRFGAPQGNLNPEMYRMASTVPAAFHDVTVATSGVSACDVNTPSMCNNSIPSATALTGGQAGYLLTDGYDEVTGLGSLDASVFLSNFEGPKATPNILLQGAYSLTTAQGLMLSLAVDGGRPVVPTGTVTFTRGTYSSSALPLNNGMLIFSFAAGVLSPGTDMLVAHYKPDKAGSQIYDSATASSSVTVIAVPMITPTVTVTPYPQNLTSAVPLSVAISVDGGPANQSPSGTVTLTSGSYDSGAMLVGGGYANFTIPARSLTPGTVTLTANYRPDAASSGIYHSASGSVTITVPPPTFTISATSVSVLVGATTGNMSTVTVTPADGFTGSIALSATVTSSPFGAQHLPTVSFGSTSAVTITGTGAGTATLTISTTPATSSALIYPIGRGVRWFPTAGTALGCILLLGIPARRRKWRAILSLLVCFLILSSGITACGGGGGGGTVPTGGTTSPGTTKGAYVVTVSGASGGITATGVVNLTVN